MKVKFKVSSFQVSEFQRAPILARVQPTHGWMMVKLRIEHWVACSLWKTQPQSRTKPVIARDTTYGVSLLTCTTCRSKFAIPSNEISPHGNGVEIRRVKEDRRPVRARGDSASCRRNRGAGVRLLIHWSGAKAFHNHELQPSGGLPKAEAGSPV